MSVSKELKVYYNLGKAEEEKANFKTIKFDDIAEPTLEYLIPLALKEYDIDAAEESNYLLRYVNKKLFFKDANEAITAQDVLLVNALDEAKEAVAEIETIVEELYQNYSLKTMKDLFSKKEISIESKNFLNEITKNFEMQLDVYVEEFIRLGGSNQLMSLAVLIDGSTLGCCLKMFYVTTIYLNGVKFLKQRPENISKLYNLLEKDELTVKKNTLGILCSLLRDMDGAFAIINKAAVAHGLKNQRSPYSPLVEALATKDLELKERVLHFFNWMIFKCPKEELCCKFQSRLENLGVFEECQKIVKVSNPKLRKQLMLFQQNNNVIIKSSMYELEIHRNRIIELERNCQSFEKKLSSLQEQQNFYGIIKNDYQRFYEMARKSMEKATLFNPFIATGNYKKDDLMKLPELKRNIVDLRDAIQENKETVDKLNTELKKIQGDNKELQSYVSQLTSDNDALNQANQKLIKPQNPERLPSYCNISN